MGLIFFFSQSVLFYFEVATFSSIALRVFACALRLSLFVASRSQWGIQEAGCSAQGVQRGREAEAKVVWVGRRLKHTRLDRRGRREGTVLLTDSPEEAICALSGSTPACLPACLRFS